MSTQTLENDNCKLVPQDRVLLNKPDKTFCV